MNVLVISTSAGGGVIAAGELLLSQPVTINVDSTAAANEIVLMCFMIVPFLFAKINKD
jgi:hypothetical protein